MSSATAAKTTAATAATAASPAAVSGAGGAAGASARAPPGLGGMGADSSSGGGAVVAAASSSDSSPVAATTDGTAVPLTDLVGSIVDVEVLYSVPCNALTELLGACNVAKVLSLWLIFSLAWFGLLLCGRWAGIGSWDKPIHTLSHTHADQPRLQVCG